MMSSGREKLLSVFGNGKISDSCCVTNENKHKPQANDKGVRNDACDRVCPHQSLHVIHGSQMVPDHGGRHLPANVLTELVSNADHVEVTVHT